MKSPFPGMDPYLETHWRDVHATLIVHARAMISRQLSSDLRARVDERLVVEHPWEAQRWISPDVRVVEHGLPTARGVEPISGVALAEPLVIASAEEESPQRFIEIIDPADGGTVVTVIEFPSPTNKLAGDGRDKYQRKQRDVVNAGINLVEIDLTRAGRREPAYPLANLPPRVRGAAYLACVYRGFGKRQYEIYTFPLREPMKAIRVPLRATDADVVLDLQSLVDTAYEEGRHDDIDYAAECVPPLESEDAGWADALLRTAGRR